MLILHWFPGTCSRVPLVALEEAGADFETRIQPRLATDPQALEQWKREINPKGQVPTLEIDGLMLTEVPAIVTQLDRRFPDASLLPGATEAQRLDALSTMCWFSAGIHPSIGRSRFPAFYGPQECSEGIREMALVAVSHHLNVVEQRLEGRDWVCGDRWTILDAYLLWLWFRASGSGIDRSPYPRIAELADRCQERPSVANALDREEQAFAELKADGLVPPNWPLYQVGRVPAEI
jgi:glutathione S-transferase